MKTIKEKMVEKAKDIVGYVMVEKVSGGFIVTGGNFFNDSGTGNCYFSKFFKQIELAIKQYDDLDASYSFSDYQRVIHG